VKVKSTLATEQVTGRAVCVPEESRQGGAWIWSFIARLLTAASLEELPEAPSVQRYTQPVQVTSSKQLAHADVRCELCHS